jgi:hypothetical protein
MQWAALSNHGWLHNQLSNDIELHGEIIDSVQETHGVRQRTDLGATNRDNVSEGLVQHKTVVPAYND